MWDSANVFPLKNPEMDCIQLCPLLCCSEPLSCFSIEAWAWLLPLRPAQCGSHRLFRQAVIVLKFSKRWGLFLPLASCLSRWEKNLSFILFYFVCWISYFKKPTYFLMKYFHYMETVLIPLTTFSLGEQERTYTCMHTLLLLFICLFESASH